MEGTVRSIETSALPEDVFAVASDIESYPEWASAVKEVEVLERDDEERVLRARLTVDIMIRQITYVLNYEWDNPPHSFEWTAEPSQDIEVLDGRYEFNPLEDGSTEIVYALRVEPAFKVPGFFRRQAEKQIVGTALRELKRWTESHLEDDEED